MDSCPRQNPAYRLAKEEPPQGGSSISSLSWCWRTSCGQLRTAAGGRSRSRRLRPLVLDAGETPLTPAREELVGLGITRAIGVVEEKQTSGVHRLHCRFED